ncbi:hypothetical protein P5673_006701, partial [Acropora cervicornis]
MSSRGQTEGGQQPDGQNGGLAGHNNVHELSDDETRPDDHSVTTEVETAEAVASARERVPAHADITLTESQDSMQELSPDENSACSGDSQQCEAGGSTAQESITKELDELLTDLLGKKKTTEE